MALYRGQVHGSIGGEFLFLCFIVIIIGGLDFGRRLVCRLDPGRAHRRLLSFSPRSWRSCRTSWRWSRRCCGARAGSTRSAEDGYPLRRSAALPGAADSAHPIIIGLALAPFLFPGAKALNAAAKTCLMILLVASYITTCSSAIPASYRSRM